MRFAIDDRAKKEVDARDVSEFRARSRVYSCPCCGGRVHYRRSSASGSDPIFAHNAYTGTDDCENYYPGMIVFSAPDPATPSKVRPKVETEDDPNEFGLCLEDAESWRLYLRFPEITADELRNTSPKSLLAAAVQVDAGDEKKSIPLLDLRPGTGAARLLVPPVTSSYKVTTTGTWPRSVREQRWQAWGRGLNPRGTLFRLRHGEWVRLNQGSAVEYGEELRVIADEKNGPPFECWPTAGSLVLVKGRAWRLWHVLIPSVGSERLDTWTEAIEVEAVEPAWKVKLVNVPQTVISEKDVSVYRTRQPIIARLEAPSRGARTELRLSTGTNRSSDTFALPTGSNCGFVAFSVTWPNSNELAIGYDDRARISFETDNAVDLSSIKRILAAVPLLRLSIGDATVPAWSEAYECTLPPLDKEQPVIALSPALEDLRLRLAWKYPDEDGAEEDLTVEWATKRLNAFIEVRREVEVRVDAGALGNVMVQLRLPSSAKTVAPTSARRKLRWLRTAMSSDGEVPLPVSCVRGGLKIDRAIAGSKGRKWMPLALKTMKEPTT